MTKTFIFFGLFFLIGCAQITVGMDFDKTKVEQIVKGKSSKEEVVKILGEPVEKETEARVERWIYVNRVTSAAPKPEWIRLSYQGEVKEKKLVILFDQDTVKDVLFYETIKPFGSSLGLN